MSKRPPIPVSIIVLLIASIACSQSAPASAPMDPNALATSVAQTVVARQTEIAINNPVTAIPTSTLLTPTLTFTPELSATPDYTATLSAPMISVSEDTNCRVGPGKLFERAGILLVGETAEIVGREPKGEYWLIRNPDEGVEYCWVWGEYGTITGNIYILLVYTPPPPPVSSFSVSYAGLETCNLYWVDFKLTNASDALFKSIAITLSDATTVTVVSMQSNVFINNDACGGPISQQKSLVAGGTVTVSSPSLGYNPSGHNLNAKITLCTEPDQAGTCVTQEIGFKP